MAVAKQMEYVSASQIKKFVNHCSRLWYFEYPLGLRGGETEAMRYGKKVHSDAEDFLNGEKSELETPEMIFARENGFFPGDEIIASPSFIVERQTEDIGITLAELPIRGYIDIAYWDDELGMPVASDWKTRSSYEYAPDAAQLAENIQMMIYGHALLELFKDREPARVKVEHINLLKKAKGGPGARRVSAIVTREHVAEQMAKLAEIVELMKEAYQAEIRTVPQNRSNCWKYNRRCDHMDACYHLNFKPTGTFLDADEQEKNPMDLDALLGPTDADESKTGQLADAVSPKRGDDPSTTPEKKELLTNSQMLKRLKHTYHQMGENFTYAAALPNHPCPDQVRDDFEEWRAEQQPEQPAPNVMPPDAEPDREPKDISNLTVAEYDWQKAGGVGDTAEEKIKAHLADEGVEMLRDVTREHVTAVKGIGKTTADNIMDTLAAEKNFEPEADDVEAAGELEADDVDEPETDEQPQEASDVLNNAKKALVLGDDEQLEAALRQMSASQINKFEKSAEAITDKRFTKGQDELVRRATDAVKAGEVPDVTGMADDVKEAFLAWRKKRKLEAEQAEAEAANAAKAATEETADAPSDEPTQAIASNNNVNVGGVSVSDNTLVLYVNCAPSDGNFTELTDLLAPLKDDVCEALSVPYWDFKPYAEGGKLLGALVIERLGKFVGDIVIDTTLPEMARVLEILTPHADRIVRSIKA